MDGPTVAGRPARTPAGFDAPGEAVARLRGIFDSAAIGIAVVELDGTIAEANAALASMLGYPVAQLCGRSYVELTHPDDVAEDRRLADELFAGVRSSYVLEKRYVRKDSQVVWGRLTASLVRDEGGTPRFGLGMVVDITAERRADEARAYAVTRYRTLVETIPAVTYVWESTDIAVRGPRPPDDAGLTYTSPQIEQLLGYTAAEWESDPMFWATRIHPDDRERVLRQTADTERDGSPYSIEHRYLAKDGRVVWVQDQAVLIERLPDGRPWRFQGVMVDITQRKLAEESLAETTERLNAIVDGSPLAIMSVDLRGVVRSWNPAAERIFGWRADEAIGRFMPHVPTERRAEFDRFRDSILRDGRVGHATEVRLRKDGSTIEIQLSSAPMRDRFGRVVGLVNILADITETREAQRRLADAERRFRTLVEQMPAVTFTDDDTPEHSSIYISPQLVDLIGVDAADAMADPDLFGRHIHPDDAPRVWDAWRRALATGMRFEAEYRVVHVDGRVRWVLERSSVSRAPSGEALVQGVLFDVTERKSAEEILRASEAEVRRSLDVLRRADEERRELLVHLVASEAAERGRMAEGIEDRSLQDIAAVGMRLETLRRGLDDPDHQGAIDRLTDSVQQTLDRLRHLLVQLRPRELETGGLADALRRYLATIAPTGVRTRVDDAAMTTEPDLDVRSLAFRIAQDAISAAFGRLQEGELVVELDRVDDGIRVRVRDSGRGVPNGDDARAGSAEAVPPEPISDALSVVSMRERAEVAGGWLTTEATADGTMVEFWLPARRAAAPDP